MIFYTTDSETDEYCICDEKKLPLVTDMHRRRTFGLARHVLVQGSLQRLLQTSWQSYFQKKKNMLAAFSTTVQRIGAHAF
jgi:UV DNA damage repair endonuclease